MNIRSLIGIPFLAVGSAMLIAAAVAWVRRDAFLANAIETDGAVVDHVSYSSVGPDRGGAVSGVADGTDVRQSSSFPVVEFRAQDGSVNRFMSGTLGFPPPERVRVLYLPDDPSRAQVLDFFAQTGWILVLAGLGTAFVLGGGLAWKLLEGERDPVLHAGRVSLKGAFGIPYPTQREMPPFRPRVGDRRSDEEL